MIALSRVREEREPTAGPKPSAHSSSLRISPAAPFAGVSACCKGDRKEQVQPRGVGCTVDQTSDS